ncbi:maleylacetoacetate isomerase [Novosphingobium flavum]|uniref:Maleylacetoacetate isomerase n=1 Tax=Novosphingobium flavum TaxID=1778672 RepID=A0A7X1KLB6_9SPHN|nr:maleylacetoacetate isomerase [Novosphingobium flavum]MBC2665414.1 maleylacetoacetate isomerase [Novosphingobium flavum]
MTEELVLHGFFRSSASYRVRIALGLKGISYRDAFHNLRKDAQKAPAYLSLNPQGLVPALETAGGVLTQSLAICEYLDEIQPVPPLLPADPFERARVRAFVLAIACEIHPLQNLGTLRHLRALGIDAEGVNEWARSVIDTGLEACSRLIADQGGPYCFGDAVTLADVCLVPQLANARRFGARTDWPRLAEIEANCLALPAFQRARPDAQGDAVE